MKILTGSQIKEVDRATIERESIESIELMERAAEMVAQWICNNIDNQRPLLFLIGKGGNGGDGLAVARMVSMVSNAGFACTVKLFFDEAELSDDCRTNFGLLPNEVEICSDKELDSAENMVVVDALFGAGFKGVIKEELAQTIALINQLRKESRGDITVISIDIPSGMATEFGNQRSMVVEADVTLTMQFPKLSMLLPESGDNCGKIEVLDIELDGDYIEAQPTQYHYITETLIKQLILPRAKFSHKGTFGHALLICGSEGMMGAAVLAVSGALRSGCGLVTAHLPRQERLVMNASCPSTIVSIDNGIAFSQLPESLDKYTILGIGCGLGQAPQSVSALSRLMKEYKRPMVFDADALNILAMRPNSMKDVPAGSVFTPHLGELKRLVGPWTDQEHKIELTRKLAAQTNSTIVVKGAHTMVCFADGTIYFNSTGCSGMAKGGFGDVLTGFITGLIARGYSSQSAAILGVYLHGLAGERCGNYYGQEAMNSSDLSEFLVEAMHEIE